MNSLVVILFLVGIALLLIEVAVPGGIIGTAGALCLFGGIIAAFYHHGVNGGFIAIGAGLVITVAGLYVEFRIIPRTRYGKKLFLSAAVTGSTSSAAASITLVGRTGEALTALAPSGLVLLEGRKYEASSRAGFIEQGSTVIVRGGDNFRVIVEKSIS